MDNNEMENVAIDKEFVDEHGEKATMHIEPVNGYKINMFNQSQYKLANAAKGHKDLLGVKRKNGLFTRDIGFKSSGFAQIASLSFIVALAGMFVFYLMFRY